MLPLAVLVGCSSGESNKTTENTSYAKANFTFLSESTLQKNKALLQSNQAPADMKQAYARLLEEAENALKVGKLSVTDKGMTPPSGSKNDYLSISPYWWPDPDKKDGLPWIRHDGKTNPASKTSETDSRRIGLFTRSVRALAIAYYFSGDEKYAKQGIEYVDHWFLNPETKMNPNVNFGQGVPGRADGRRSGIIDTRSLSDRMLDALAMLSTSEHWTDKHQQGMQEWYGEYLHWMLTDKLSGAPGGEADAENNHGSFYDMQVAGIAYFLGKNDLAKKMVEKGKMRVDTQFEADGSQPHEISRTRAYHYHYFNLDALSGVAIVGDKLGMDLWNYKSPKGASLQTAVELMAKYHDPNKAWPYTAKDKRRRVERMSPIYLKAGLAADNKELIKLARETDFSGFTVKKNLAEVWAQRDIELLLPRD